MCKQGPGPGPPLSPRSPLCLSFPSTELQYCMDLLWDWKLWGTEPGSPSWKGPELTAMYTLRHVHPSSLPFPAPTHTESRKKEGVCKSLALRFCLPGALGSGARLAPFLCVIGGGERLETLGLAHPQLSFWRVSQAHCPLTPAPRSQHMLWNTGVGWGVGAELAHPGLLTAFQACVGRFGDFSLTMPVVQ